MEETKKYKFFQHKECEYFPCQKGVAPEKFNCIFCYCPLYMLGDKCGGNFKYLENGIKDCTDCVLPHNKDNYDYIINRLSEYISLEAEKKQTDKLRGDLNGDV